MKSGRLLVAISAVAVAASMSLAPAVAQKMRSGLYVYHTRASGGCPGLDWHINLEPDGHLVGFVAWDQMKHMARLDGMMSKDGTFEMDAKEVATGKTATVKGNAAGEYIDASVNGSGTACDGKMLQIPRDVGGLQGGGG